MFDIGLADLDEVELGSGKVVPRELLAAMLEKNLPADGMDVTLVKIEVSGVKSGKKLKSTWEIIDRYDDENAMTSMMRMTGYPAAIVGLMLARGNTNGPGALPQEKALKLDKFMDELKKRNINFNVKEGRVK